MTYLLDDVLKANRPRESIHDLTTTYGDQMFNAALSPTKQASGNMRFGYADKYIRFGFNKTLFEVANPHTGIDQNRNDASFKQRKS